MVDWAADTLKVGSLDKLYELCTPHNLVSVSQTSARFIIELPDKLSRSLFGVKQ